MIKILRFFMNVIDKFLTRFPDLEERRIGEILNKIWCGLKDCEWRLEEMSGGVVLYRRRASPQAREPHTFGQILLVMFGTIFYGFTLVTLWAWRESLGITKVEVLAVVVPVIVGINIALIAAYCIGRRS
jgi:hypothetical protein